MNTFAGIVGFSVLLFFGYAFYNADEINERAEAREAKEKNIAELEAAKPKPEIDNWNWATVACRNKIKESIPTAEFPTMPRMKFQKPDQQYVIKSDLQGQSNSGSIVSATYHCDIKLIGSDVQNQNNWKIINLEIL